jgi:periplasmic protein CpxP/Spy
MNKKTQILMLSFAVLIALVGLPCVAQTPADQAPSQAAGAASQAATDSMSQANDASLRAKVQEKLQHLSSELNLTDDQKQKIKPILQNEIGQIKTVHDDSSLSSDQKQAQMKDIHASAKTQINEILTPDQQKKLATMKEEKGW